jgi:hypothetical protein
MVMPTVVKGQFLWMCECVREDGGDGGEEGEVNEEIKGRSWQIERRNGKTRSKDRERRGRRKGTMRMEGRNTN